MTVSTRMSVLGAALILAGCQTAGIGVSPTGPQPVSAVVPISAAGISGGGLVGGKFGENIAKADKQLALNAEYKALEYAGGGELVTWAGSAGGASGTVVAAQPYRVGSQDCRQYSHEITMAGQTSKARGTACRNSDGSWTLLE